MKLIQTIAIVGLTTTFASADLEREVRLDDCPAAVRETIVANSRDGRIDEIDLIAIGENKMYIAEVDLAQDTDLKVYVNADGSLVKTREDVRNQEIPAFVNTIVSELGGRADDVEKETTGKTVTYHVDVDRTDAPDLEVVIDGQGKVLSKTEEIDD